MKPRFWFLAIVVAFCVWLTAALWTGASAGEPSETTGPEPTPPPPATVEGKNAKEWHAVAARHLASSRRWHTVARRYRRQLLVHWHPTVSYAYSLAAAVFGVPRWQLQAVGACESGHYPFADNGRYHGIMQLGWRPFGLSPYDPVANVLSAAQTVQRDGSWRQWECKP